MEGLYLLCSIITTTVTSFLLSLLLPFHYLHKTFFFFRSSHQPKPGEEDEDDDQRVVVMYEGSVWHERRRPVHHSFKYSVRYALVDMDKAPNTLSSSFCNNHLSAHQAREITATNGPVYLLTIPPSVGYEQNPLSVYYCYNLEGSKKSLTKCVAEVTNTPWGERVSFVFEPDSDLVAKPLHVSPFMDMLGNWRMRAKAPGDHLFIEISVEHPELGNYFIATLKAKRVSSRAPTTALFFWLMPHKVALWIYWQAVKLWWKNVNFIQHPRYTNPTYREEASLRNRKLQGCPIVVQNEDKHSNHDASSSNHMTTENNLGDRWCVWRDAQWPWN